MNASPQERIWALEDLVWDLIEILELENLIVNTPERTLADPTCLRARLDEIKKARGE